MINTMLQLVAAVPEKIDASKVGIPNATPGAVNNIFEAGLNLVYFIAGIVCVIVLVIAGIQYSISQGDANKVKTAKDAILYAVVGLAVIMMAFVITGFVIGRLA